jgi:polyhydroxyalkanoate synthesis repressor PhaR
MRIIKRYPNRKLYDTDQRSYITLEGVAELIRDGETVQVIDYTSGEDLTSQTLSQIILEKEKNQAGFLPQHVLASLVQAGGKTVGGLQRALASSLGWWSQFDEEIKHRLDALVERGDLTEPEAEGLLQKIAGIGESLKSTTVKQSQQTIEDFLRQRGVPSKQEVQQISAQLDALEAKIAALGSEGQADAGKQPSSPSKPAASRQKNKTKKKFENTPAQDNDATGVE